ncbi:hypothetical protein [Aurantiacibacter spongiae]|uniref:Ferrochelatase n=1 Tax=Aurantiacibacter spongiae TaxID=2488860 RepID=A0A3N5DFI8_9SPHN|nr:hypothetical protein [Aurantiacibacter spongiae]RPF70412.1 hypothetical protein EG799_01295 [Aurantiacibacter spongiae]
MKKILYSTIAASILVGSTASAANAAPVLERDGAPVAAEENAGISSALLILLFAAIAAGIVILVEDNNDDEDLPTSP